MRQLYNLLTETRGSNTQTPNTQTKEKKDGTNQSFVCMVATELAVRHTLGPSQIHCSVPYQALL